MSNKEVVIAIRDVVKSFRLFASPRERLLTALHPLRKKPAREFRALQGLSLEIHKGEIVGILGRNGSGKSTLLQIVCGIIQPTHGQVLVKGRVSALLELGAGFNPEFSGRENVILNGAIMGFSREEMLRRLPQISAFADIGEFLDRPVKTYSSGMFVRLAFAAAIHVDPDILIVDEALSVGDASFQHRCYQKIREFMAAGKTILVVSHATDMLLRICDRGVVIDGGALRHVGPIAEAVTHYHALLFGSQLAAPDIAPTPKNDRDKVNVSTHERTILSNDSTERVTERATYNPHETRLGSGLVKLVDYEIVADGTIDPPAIPAHADVELIVKLHFGVALERVSFGFALVSLDGSYVAGTNSDMTDGPYLAAGAGECLLVRLRWRAHLVGGEYFLNLGCHHFPQGEKIFLDVRRSLARLKFADTPGSYGFADLQYTARIESLSDTPAVH